MDEALENFGGFFFLKKTKILSYITSASGSELFKSELDATESVSDGLLFSFTLALR